MRESLVGEPEKGDETQPKTAAEGQFKQGTDVDPAAEEEVKEAAEEGEEEEGEQDIEDGEVEDDAELEEGFDHFTEYESDGGHDPATDPAASAYIHFANGVRAFYNSLKIDLPGSQTEQCPVVSCVGRSWLRKPRY